MRRFTIAVTVGAMILGTMLSGANAVSAAPFTAAPLGKAVTNAAKAGMVEEVRHRHRGHRRHRHRGGDAALALGAAGLFLGLSALAARPRYYDPYYDDAPIRYSYEPWSPAWFDDCADRFQTFNPRTGYYKGYDGEYHFCR